MALRHAVYQHQAAWQGGTGHQPAVVGHDGHVVKRVHADGMGWASDSHVFRGHGGFEGDAAGAMVDIIHRAFRWRWRSVGWRKRLAAVRGD